MESGNEIRGVDVVTDLFGLVAKHGVRAAGDRALGQVRQKAVQHRARVIRTGEAAAAKTGGLETEVAAVLLNEHVGRDFRRAEE